MIFRTPPKRHFREQRENKKWGQNGQFSVRFCVKRNLFGPRVENHVYANKPRKKGIFQILKSSPGHFSPIEGHVERRIRFNTSGRARFCASGEWQRCQSILGNHPFKLLLVSELLKHYQIKWKPCLNCKIGDQKGSRWAPCPQKGLIGVWKRPL